MPRLLTLTALGVVGAFSNAHADPDAPPSPSPSSATASTEQLTLPAGKLVLDAFIEINLSANEAGKPISLSPDLWYGVNNDLTIGLVHSSVGATGFLGGVGDSLCFSGTGSGCRNFYDNVGVDVRYRLATPWAFDGGLYAVDTSPFELALKLGISGRWRWEKYALELQPNLFLGLTNRLPTTTVMGVTLSDGPPNQEVLNIPVTGSYEVMPKLELAAQVGVALPFENAGDTYRIPLSLAGRYEVMPKLDLGLVFTLTALAGGDKILHGFDGRTLQLGGSYAF